MFELFAKHFSTKPAIAEGGDAGRGPVDVDGARRARGEGPGCCAGLLHCEGSGKLDRARSRLYRGQIYFEILKENVRLKALAEIYTMHSFALL